MPLTCLIYGLIDVNDIGSHNIASSKMVYCNFGRGVTFAEVGKSAVSSSGTARFSSFKVGI
jgi:hypothetical protein